MGSKDVLSAKNSAELLSYIINITPELKANIDLPKQGESIKPIGKIIVDNERYRNAFINTVNLIGLTVIKRNGWDNPWKFTKRGTLRYGQQIRELIHDLCNVYDYNKNFSNKQRFLSTTVPNIFNYIHEINFQKFYQTTTSDMQISMAFESEDSLFEFVDKAIYMLYESLKYDTFLVDKYMLCRRILDGTITSVQIVNYDNLTPRQRVSALKSVSNKMTFRSPNYNPAGIRRATDFDKQIAIINTVFESDLSTEVLATSFFKDEADMKIRGKLIDSFSEHDEARLTELLEEAYIPFTSAEKAKLDKIPVVIISDEWFMDYDYALDNESETKQTEFYNPTTLENNHFLHAWRVFSTSPFENAVVFTSEAIGVTSVVVSPLTATVTKGQTLQLSATVETTGFANKAVLWSVDNSSKADGVTINDTGLLTVPSTATVESITVTAQSIYDSTVTGTATITVAGTTPAQTTENTESKRSK